MRFLIRLRTHLHTLAGNCGCKQYANKLRPRLRTVCGLYENEYLVFLASHRKRKTRYNVCRCGRVFKQVVNISCATAAANARIWTNKTTLNALTFGTGVLHLIQINHQPDAVIFQFIILTFVYSSTCFGRFPAHPQELNDCSSSLWFYLRIVVIVVLLFVF
jgi:hypothetical protein